MVKKNFLFGLKLLLLLLFTMLFVTCSTCFASTTINNEEAEYLITYLFGTEYDTTNVINFLGPNNTGNASKSNFNLDTITNDFISYFNANNTLDFNRNYTIFYNRQYNDYNSTSFNGAIYYSNFNNGKSSNYPHLYIRIQPDTSVTRLVGFFPIDDNKNALSDIPLYIIEYSVNNGIVTFTNYRTSTMPTNFNNVNFKWVNYDLDWNHYNFATNSSLIENIPGIVSFSKTNAIYTNYNGVNYSSDPYTKLLDTFYVYESEPVVPEDTTGNITDDEGNITGNVDLGGIVTGIKDVQNQISGDTQRIIDNQNAIAEQQHEDLTGTTTTVDVSGEFDNMLSSTHNVVDPTTNFFSWLLDNIRSVLNSTGNYNIQTELFGKTYTIRSDFFVLPDGDLKTFLQLCFVAWFAYHIILKIRYIVYAVQCVKISDALHQVDFNPDIL